MGDDFIYDASLVSEDVWIDFWRLNGEARIIIERLNPTGGNAAMMDPPDENPTYLKGVRAIIHEVDIDDISSGAGRLRIGDKKFETIDEVKYGDFIQHGNESYEVFRIDTVNIGEMKIYLTKAHKVS